MTVTSDSPAVELVDTSVGPARVHLDAAGEGRALVVLGHGAGGGVGAPDLVAVRAALLAAGAAVARVEQPYRVAGRRAPAPAARLDTAWTEVVGTLRTSRPSLPLVVGGRSSGARVACRTADAAGAAAVVALAFPLHPPGRPGVTRRGELAGVRVPVLVVQGERDAFGGPDEVAAAAGSGVRVHPVAGADHGLKRDLAGTGEAVVAFLRDLGLLG